MKIGIFGVIFAVQACIPCLESKVKQSQRSSIRTVLKTYKNVDNSATYQVLEQDQHLREFYQQLLYNRLKSQPSNVTCPEIGFTFTNEHPFDILGLPECGDKVRIGDLNPS